MNSAVIGLGSNIDPQINIDKARQVIAADFRVMGESSFIQTSPVGFLDQPDFINGSILMETEMGLEELKKKLKETEVVLGRKSSTQKCGPRTIDLDIVAFNGKIIDQDFYQRDYLKESVLQVLPGLEY